LTADCDVLAEENAQLKARYSELDKMFGELNTEWVRLKDEEWQLRSQLQLKGEELQQLSEANPVPATDAKHFLSQLLEKINSKEAGYVRNSSQKLILELREFCQSLTQIP
jgi:chromosome segregation ATPase